VLSRWLVAGVGPLTDQNRRMTLNGIRFSIPAENASPALPRTLERHPRTRTWREGGSSHFSARSSALYFVPAGGDSDRLGVGD